MQAHSKLERLICFSFAPPLEYVRQTGLLLLLFKSRKFFSPVVRSLEVHLPLPYNRVMFFFSTKVLCSFTG